jgi:AcrR family transcriptional regulator
MSVRRESKFATRAKVLEAARLLFDRDGYEQTTIRGIADEAGVSAGSVFTTFANKAEILGEVVADRLALLGDELRSAIPKMRGSLLDILTEVLMICYRNTQQYPGLIMAMIAQNFIWPPAGEPFYVNEGLVMAIQGVLARAQAANDLKAGGDLTAAADVIVAIYKANYEKLCTNQIDQGTLYDLVRRQLAVVVEGLHPGHQGVGSA